MASRCVARPIAGRDMSIFDDRVWLRGAFRAISRVGAACVIMGVQTMLMQKHPRQSQWRRPQGKEQAK